MRSVRLLLGLIVFLLTPAVSLAYDDSQNARLEHAKRLLEASNEEGLRASYIDLYAPECVKSFKEWRPSASDNDVLNFQRIVRGELGSEFDKLTELKMHYYAARFTVQELDEWTAMLHSPIAKKILKAAPDIQRDLFPIQRGALQEALSRATIRLDNLRTSGGPM